VDGSQQLVPATEVVKAAATHVRATTMHRLAIVVQPLTVHLPHAAKTVAILAHLHAITVPKRVVIAITEAQ
jgi:hypothetical protein